MHPHRVGRRWKNSRSKRRRGLVVQETSTVPSSSTESTTNGMHTPTERVVAVDVEKVSARFACLDVEGEETTKRFTPATAVSLSPRTRQREHLEVVHCFQLHRLLILLKWLDLSHLGMQVNIWLSLHSSFCILMELSGLLVGVTMHFGRMLQNSFKTFLRWLT